MIRHIYRQAVINTRQTYIDMVDYLNSLDRSENENSVSFQETNEGRTRAA